MPQAVYAAGNSRAEGTIYVRRTIYETKFQFIPAERFGFFGVSDHSEKVLLGNESPLCGINWLRRELICCANHFVIRQTE